MWSSAAVLGHTNFRAEGELCLGVIGKEKKIRLGGGLGGNAVAWAKIADDLPKAGEGPGSSAAVDFALGPGETRVVRFLLAWHSPRWKGGGHPSSDKGNSFTHMYALQYRSARTAAWAWTSNMNPC